MNNRRMDRREFLQRAAVAGAALAASGQGLASSPATGMQPWFDRPMRWAQLTLAENDPGQYDPQFWLDYFRRTHSDAACLSAGGCVAYYPTKIPLHYRSQWLGDRDSFGDLVAGCRKLNMVVLARTDPHAAHQDVYDAHPDWIAVDAQGRKRRHSVHAGAVGHLRAGAVQLRVHDRGDARDRLAVPGGRHLQQPLGGLGHVLLRALPAEFQDGLGHGPAAHRQSAGSRAARLHRRGSSSACSSSGGCGTTPSATPIPTPASSPTPAAARSAIWI